MFKVFIYSQFWRCSHGAQRLKGWVLLPSACCFAFHSCSLEDNILQHTNLNYTTLYLSQPSRILGYICKPFFSTNTITAFINPFIINTCPPFKWRNSHTGWTGTALWNERKVPRCLGSLMMGNTISKVLVWGQNSNPLFFPSLF